MKGLKNKVPVTYTKLDRIEYIYACLAPYGISRRKIRMVLDKDEQFARDVLRNGDMYKFGNICKLKLRYVPKSTNVGKYNLATNSLMTVDSDEYNRVTCQPMAVFNDEIKAMTYGDAYYFSDEDEDDKDWQES